MPIDWSKFKQGAKNAVGKGLNAITVGHNVYNPENGGHFQNVVPGLVGSAATYGLGTVGGIPGVMAGRGMFGDYAAGRESLGQAFRDVGERFGFGRKGAPGYEYNPDHSGDPNGRGGGLASAYTGSLGGQMPFNPDNPSLSGPSTNVLTGGGNEPLGQTPWNPGQANFQLNDAPYTGLYGPSTDVQTGGDAPSGGGGNTGVQRGAGNPAMTGGFTGNRSGGVLGGGTAVDPSQWGQFGFGGSDTGSGGAGLGYQTAMLSGGMGAAESGRGAGFMGSPLAMAAALRARTGGGMRPSQITPRTGGGMKPSQVPGNTGIVPPSMQQSYMAGALRKKPGFPPGGATFI